MLINDEQLIVQATDKKLKILSLKYYSQNILKQYIHATHIKTFTFKTQNYCHIYWNRYFAGMCSNI